MYETITKQLDPYFSFAKWGNILYVIMFIDYPEEFHVYKHDGSSTPTVSLDAPPTRPDVRITAGGLELLVVSISPVYKCWATFL